MNLLVINGPNLNLLGIREPNIYGDQSFAALERFIQAAAQESGASVEFWRIGSQFSRLVTIPPPQAMTLPDCLAS